MVINIKVEKPPKNCANCEFIKNLPLGERMCLLSRNYFDSKTAKERIINSCPLNIEKEENFDTNYLYEKLVLFKKKVRYFFNGYHNFGVNAKLSEDTKLHYDTLVGWYLSLNIVFGIPLLVIGFLTACLFKEPMVSFYVLIILFGSFIVITFGFRIFGFLLELILSALVDLFDAFKEIKEL